MKQGFLFLSLTANLVLAMIFLWSHRPQNEPSPAASKIKRILKKPSDKLAIPKSPPPVSSPNWPSWQDFATTDLSRFVNQLRQLECPEETVIDIILVYINQAFDAREASLRQPKKAYRYWVDGDDAPTDADTRQALFDLGKQKAALVKAILGIDYYQHTASTDWYISYRDSNLGFLTREKRLQLQDTGEEWSIRINRYAESLGELPLDAEERKTMENLRKQRDEALAALLTPEEKAEMDLRTSLASRQIRALTWDLSEEEFRTLYRDAKNQNIPDRDWDAMEGFLKTRLGERRFTEMEFSRDEDYRKFVTLASSLNLPKESAFEVEKIRRDAESDLRKLFADKTLSNQDKHQRLQLMKTVAEASVKQHLGQAGFESYKKESYSTWLHAYQPSLISIADQFFTNEEDSE